MERGSGSGRGRPKLPVFTEISKESGLLFKHSYGDHHLDNIVEGTGAGACFFDYNGDGWMDVYFVTGTWTKSVSDNEGRDLRGKLSNQLYQQQRQRHLHGRHGEGRRRGQRPLLAGCSAADYDNDGHVDLYVLNYGSNILYHNNGDGTFTDVAKVRARRHALERRRRLARLQQRRLLDVFVANYLMYDDGKFRDFYPAAGLPRSAELRRRAQMRSIATTATAPSPT